LLTEHSNAVSYPRNTNTSNTPLLEHKTSHCVHMFHKGLRNYACLLKYSSFLNNEDNIIDIFILFSIPSTFSFLNCTEGKLQYIEFIIIAMNKRVVVIHVLERVKK